MNFNATAAPFYPPYMLHRMARPDEKVKRHVRARLLYLLKPESQFLSENGDTEGYVSIQRILSTGQLRAYEAARIKRLIYEVVAEEQILEVSEATEEAIRYCRNSPLIVAASILE